jgi:hypothetical protein
MKLNEPSLLSREELIDAIGYAHDHPAMPMFYDLLYTVEKADLVLAINKVEAELIIEALTDLSNWVESEEIESIEKLLGVLVNARVPS